jgi:hypothetical protein
MLVMLQCATEGGEPTSVPWFVHSLDNVEKDQRF